MGAELLEKHRIREIKTLRISSRYTRTIGRNSRIKYHGNGPDSQIRVIITDQGAIGWGISWIPDDRMPDLTGRSIAELFDPEIGVITNEAMPLDFPLHDLAGVILDQPVYQMLGRKGELAVPCYDGAIYMDDLDNPSRGIDAVIESCLDDYNLGYRYFKIKIGRGYQWMDSADGLQRDIEVTRAIHKNLPNCRILVDGNDAFTCEDAIRYMDAVSDCNIFWFEEPFRENRDDLVKLKEFLARRSSNTLVADGESGPDIEFLLKMSREKLLDVLQMDIAGCGFTAWRKIMPKIIEAGALTSPHNWGDPLKVIYSAQLAAGIGNVLTIEGIPSTTYGADLKPYKLKNGLLHIPENIPGFGMKLEI